MKVIKNIRSMLIDTKTLFKNDKEAIDKHNKEFIPKTSLIFSLIMVVPLIFSIFRISMQENVPAYLITLGAVLLLMLLFRFKKLQSHYLFFSYALAMIYFVLSSYLSLIQFSSRPAGTALTFFIVVP